uniref:Uncharacterized protein n=1 Tax=Panagrolaimus superbus TaxID=310955 RepID=A0A914XZA6_9BILA
MNNNKIIAADCLTTTTDLPVAASDSVLKNVLLSNGGIPSSGGFVILKNNNNNNNIHANSFNHQQQQQQRRRNGNIKNNGLRNNYERKKQSTPIDFENTLSSTLPSKTPILFSSPSPPASLSLSTEIRPPRKFRKNKKNRAGTNPPLSRTTSTTSSTTTITIPLSPSAISTCSLASFATTSSGLSSGASSMGTLNDPDITSIHPCPDNTVIKSSSSSAASSAGFGDMTSNDDEDFHDRSNINFFDEPLILDPIQFSRQWSMPPGGAVEIVNSHSSQILSSPLKSSKSSKRKGNGNGNNGNIKSTKNYPTITNPAIQQFYFEQHQFYRKIYDQQFAVLSATTKPPPSTVSSSTSSPASKDEVLSKSKSFDSQICESNSGSTTTTINNNNNNNGYIPHQHLGLPPLPPPQGYTPWLYPPQTYQLESPENIIPSLCEEAFLAHLKSHQIPKTLPQIASFLLASKKLSTIEIPLISTTSNLNISLPIVSPILPTLPSTPTSSTILLTEKAPQEAIAARADFHKQIRDRLLAASEKRFVLFKL